MPCDNTLEACGRNHSVIHRCSREFKCDYMPFLVCTCFKCLYACDKACCQRSTLCLEYNVLFRSSLNYRHSLFVIAAVHCAQALCIAKQAYSTVSASMSWLHVSWRTDSHTALLQQLEAMSMPACHHCISGHQAGAALPSALSVLSRFAISMAVTAASPPLLPVLPPARSRA